MSLSYSIMKTIWYVNRQTGNHLPFYKSCCSICQFTFPAFHSLRRHEILDWTQSNSDCLQDPAQNPLLSVGDFKLQLRLIQPTKAIESNLTILLKTRNAFCVVLLLKTFIIPSPEKIRCETRGRL